jgi:5-methylcytosine-specific restriction enzyme subunit McrC
LDGVALTPVTLQEVNRITFNRLNADFKPFIDICKLILEGSTLTLQASKIEIFSLMIPMEKLFEEFIAGVIQGNNLHKKVFGENYRLLIQRRIGHLAERDGRRLFGMIPDIVVKVDNEIKLVIDTKYKPLDPDSAKLGVSQQDLYQIYAYCKEYGVKKSLLIYPANLIYLDENKLKSPFKLGEYRDIEVYVRTVPLHYDLASNEGFKNFVEKLESILKTAES